VSYAVTSVIWAARVVKQNIAKWQDHRYLVDRTLAATRSRDLMSDRHLKIPNHRHEHGRRQIAAAERADDRPFDPTFGTTAKGGGDTPDNQHYYRYSLDSLRPLSEAWHPHQSPGVEVRCSMIPFGDGTHPTRFAAAR